MATYRILALDGGGIRGLVTTILLQRLVETKGLERLLDKADLVAGTSVGGIIALAIGNGMSMSRLRELFVKKGPTIFRRRPLALGQVKHDEKKFADLMTKNLGLDVLNLIRAKYEIDGLRKVLIKFLEKDTKLSDLRKKILITAFDLDNAESDKKKRMWQPKLFHNFHGEGNDPDVPAFKVGLYTSVAPTYFPTEDGYVDGGVFAGNPSMCALAHTQDKRYYKSPRRIDEIVLCSLGTGTNLRHITKKRRDWGIFQWIVKEPHLIQMILEGPSRIVDYQCETILGEDRFHRLSPAFPPGKEVDLDDVGQIPFMERFADRVDLTETVEWLKRAWF